MSGSASGVRAAFSRWTPRRIYDTLRRGRHRGATQTVRGGRPRPPQPREPVSDHRSRPRGRAGCRLRRRRTRASPLGSVRGEDVQPRLHRGGTRPAERPALGVPGVSNRADRTPRRSGRRERPRHRPIRREPAGTVRRPRPASHLRTGRRLPGVGDAGVARPEGGSVIVVRRHSAV